MHYVFFDTVNPEFIQKIARKYCWRVFEQFYRDCPDVMQKYGALNEEEMKKYYKGGKGKDLGFLNCSLLLGACSCKGCYREHISVLASDQAKCFKEELVKLKLEFLREWGKKDTKNEDEFKRVAFQCLYQSYANSFAIDNHNETKIIEIRSERWEDRVEYKRLYVYAAKGYSRKNPEGFRYVRADKKESDYKDFKNKTDLPKLMPCDNIAPVV